MEVAYKCKQLLVYTDVGIGINLLSRSDFLESVILILG